MKIALIGPGIMPIPPNGWGAVEMIIWDYYQILINHGYNVDIINTPDIKQIINTVNTSDYDIVHLHYDVFSPIMSHLKCKVKILSSHYPFINNIEKYDNDGYTKLIPYIINNKDFYIFASSEKDINTFVKHGANRNNTFLSRLGVKPESYSFQNSSEYDKTLCFSQITDRKRQYLIQNLSDVDFIGRLDDPKFKNHFNYKGELDRDFLNKEITKYSNFVLLSLIENTTPLAVKESLICGLGVVCSNSIAYELDKSKPFISVIEEDFINNIEYVSNIIKENRLISKNCRNEIRKYAISKFDINEIILNEYIPKLQSLL